MELKIIENKSKRMTNIEINEYDEWFLPLNDLYLGRSLQCVMKVYLILTITVILLAVLSSILYQNIVDPINFNGTDVKHVIAAGTTCFFLKKVS